MSKKKKIKKKIFFCETEKLDYPRFLGDFYYHGILNLPCISKSTSIRNWVTFCASCISKRYRPSNCSTCSNAYLNFRYTYYFLRRKSKKASLIENVCNIGKDINTGIIKLINLVVYEAILFCVINKSF